MKNIEKKAMKTSERERELGVEWLIHSSIFWRFDFGINIGEWNLWPQKWYSKHKICINFYYKKQLTCEPFSLSHPTLLFFFPLQWRSIKAKKISFARSMSIIVIHKSQHIRLLYFCIISKKKEDFEMEIRQPTYIDISSAASGF